MIQVYSREVYRDASPLQYRKNVQRSLDILHTHLPRYSTVLLSDGSLFRRPGSLKKPKPLLGSLKGL